MHAVVVESEADKQRIHAEDFLEVRHDRDGSARADGHRLVPPFLGQHGPRLRQRRIVERKLDRRRKTEVAKLDLAVRGQPRAHESAEGITDFLRVLFADEAERNLCAGLAWNDGFRALPRVAADDAIDLSGRTRGDHFDQHAVLLTRRLLQSDRTKEFRRRQIKSFKVGLDIGGKSFFSLPKTRERALRLLVTPRTTDSALQN